MTVDASASDASLVRLALGGDDQAFTTLVRRHKDSLYRLLRRYTGDPDEAYEAVHEAFIAAWGALNRYDPERPFIAWLRTIAINKARDRGRRMRVRRLLFGGRGLEEAEALAAVDPAPGPEESIMADQVARRLDRAIARLPESLKGPLLLTAFEELTQPEAAQTLGVSTKAVETRVHRARKILAGVLGDDLRPSDR